MADSVRNRLISKVCEALQGGPGDVRRSLTEVLRKGATLPAFVVLPHSENVGTGPHEDDLRTAIIRVICIVGTSDTEVEAIDQKVDELLNWAEQKVSGEDFDGLNLTAKATSIAWSVEAVDVDYVGAEIVFEIQYFTKRGDPTVSTA